jgi:hypothetical protein
MRVLALFDAVLNAGHRCRRAPNRHTRPAGRWSTLCPSPWACRRSWHERAYAPKRCPGRAALGVQ